MLSKIRGNQRSPLLEKPLGVFALGDTIMYATQISNCTAMQRWIAEFWHLEGRIDLAAKGGSRFRRLLDLAVPLDEK
jgi:hypothetical protein